MRKKLQEADGVSGNDRVRETDGRKIHKFEIMMKIQPAIYP